jgi:hypothetical protein
MGGVVEVVGGERGAIELQNEELVGVLSPQGQRVARDVAREDSKMLILAYAPRAIDLPLSTLRRAYPCLTASLPH